MSLRDETLRYLGYRGQELGPAEEDALVRAISECGKISKPARVWREFELYNAPGGLGVGGTVLTLPGKDVSRLLCGCQRVILSAVTLGLGLDREISLQFRRDASFGLFLDAAASAFIEEACDRLEAELRDDAQSRGFFLSRRYSPGYGDLPLSVQPLILEILDTGRRIGVTCSPSFIMTPRKSVTAITGLNKDKPPDAANSCKGCDKQYSCPYRRP
ncbi:MAG: methionine synthase [Oscillospiraceae bacterium]|jgi:hypothetical protein|nr:methionine synthase [Oscillospiraceae bacterium]